MNVIDYETNKYFQTQSNIGDLNGTYKQHYYSIEEITKPYQIIRIKIIGKDHYGYSNNNTSSHHTLNKFEIYGKIKEE